MRRWLFRLLIPAAAVALIVPLAVLSLHSPTHPAHASAPTSQGQDQCIGHHPLDFVWYTASCTGHDEPELDPLSNAPGSAKDLTWTIVLPSNGSTQVDAVGPTFWIGGAVSDPASLLGQAFLELQFYPNSLVSSCTNGGGFNVSNVAGDYTVCSPVWAVSPSGKREYAAFNAMLTLSGSSGPLVMHAGDTITDHQYVTPAADGMHITVTDLTTNQSGTIVLNSKDGPLMPAFDTQQIGNSLGWGLVHDAPNSLVWEIGHTSPFTKPSSQFCLPGSATNPACYSYNVPTWLGFQPLKVLGVTFGTGSNTSNPNGWAVVSDYGGKAEINQYCGATNYGTPFCWYPWFDYNPVGKYFTYGGDYTPNAMNFGQADQFTQTTSCGGPYGANSTYCATVLSVPGVH